MRFPSFGTESGRKWIFWAFATVVTAASVLVTATAVGIAESLDARIGLVGIVVGGVCVFAGLIWIATKLE